ncbi:MAG: PKD domain-containing protein [Flavobacteriales bacterium]|nr:PKD domain-containing protein [Flavobacteriales bacterium]MCB9197034.1 PKD domain-containing protein [Flavobacteriales bacterium]
MRKTTKRFLSLSLSLLLGLSSFAQLSQGGLPYTFANAAQPKSTIQERQLPKPDLTVVSAVDAINDASMMKPYRVGINYPVNYNAVNSGTWETTTDGGSLWRLKIHMDDAKAISLNFHNFYLPQGGKVFVYNENQSHVIGAFTAEYNNHDQIRAIQMIQGETITLEYYAPVGVTQTPIIEIKEVVYFYRGVDEFVNGYATGSNGVAKAASCQVDVACPEIAGWEQQRDAVVHYHFTQSGSTYVCSASMLNNTAQDCKPYILTAWHCGEPSAGQNLSSWVWYWNYQKSTCATGSANSSDPAYPSTSMTGGTVRASSDATTLNTPTSGNGQVAGSDFYLVELNSTPPSNYNAFYAGWNRANTGSGSGAGIHHPAGSAKKISFYTSTLTSTTYNGGVSNAHWRVVWSGSPSGHGVTEGGSSGSPIFDNNGRVVGQLSGGSSYCTATSAADLYGKFSFDWDQNGSANSIRLKPWLDPTNSGVTTLDGAYEPCNAAAAPTCNINASATSITEGGTVTFSDGSTGNPTSWSWNFDNTNVGGGTVSPATSSVQNPGAVTFPNAGTYEIELTASNANGSCTSTASVTVSAFSGCDTLYNMNDTNTITLYSITQGGVLTGTNGFGDLAKAEKFSGYSGTHVTGCELAIYAESGNNGTAFDIVVWADNAGLPGAELGRTSYDLDALAAALGGSGAYVPFNFDAPINVGGNDFYVGIDMSNYGAGDTVGIFSNLYTVTVPSTAYEQYSDGTWHLIEDYWGYAFSMYVKPFMTDMPVSGTPSASTTTGCVGSTIVFSGTGSNVNDYEWYFPGGTPSSSTTQSQAVSYATAGNYTAYVYFNGTSCSGTYLDSVQVTITSGPSVSAVPTSPSCAGNDGQIVVTATGGTSPYGYSITGGLPFQSSGTFTGLTANSYNVVVEDNNGCQATTTTTVAAGSGSLTVSAVPSNPSCAGNDGQIVVTGTGGVSPYSYSIDGGSNFVSTATFTGLSANSYNVVVQDNNGCQGSTTTTLTASTGSVTATVAPVNPSCGASDGSLTITAGGGASPYTYSIDGGSNFVSTATFTGLAVGPYSIVVLDNNGCQGTATATLTNSSAPAVTASGSNLTCNGSANGSISISATGGSTPYTYSIDGTTFGSSSTFTGLAANSYTVYVKDNGNCQGTSTVTLTQPTAVTHTATVGNATCGNTNGTLTVTASGGTSPYSYSLNSGSGQSTGTFTGLASGSYTVQVTDNAGCTSTLSTHTIGGGTAASLTTSVGNETCMDANGSITVTATGGTSPYQYSNDGGANYQTSSVFNGLSASSYSIMVLDNAGCTSTTNATVTNSGGFTLTVNPAAGQTICSGNSANISASGAGTGATYTWDQGLTAGSSHIVSPTVTTVYTVQATDMSGCTETASTTVTVQTAPTVTVIPTNPSICSGESLTLTATGAGAYVWNTGANTATITVTPTTQTTYTVIGQNGSCAGSPVQVTVGVNPSPTVVAGSDVTSVAVGGTVNFNNAGSNATSYSWNFGDGQNSTQGFVAHTYNVAGTYTVTLTGTIGTCTVTDQITIVVSGSGVGIDQVNLENNVLVYPNPNNGQFNLKLDFGVAQDVQVRLFSAIGQEVASKDLGMITSTVQEFDVSNHAEGVYFVQINTTSGTITKRVTITK